MSPLTRLAARLRSRRLAVWLIIFVIAYAFVGTVIPQVTLAGGKSVGEWQMAHPYLAYVTRALGLHVAYSSPLFLAVLGLLAVSTALCAWERTKVSWRRIRNAGRVDPAALQSLRVRPSISIPAPGVSADEALRSAAEALSGLRLRTRRGPRLLEASSGRLGLLGSPLFHWLLAALFLVIALGRLSRAEGSIGLPVGSPRTDATESYQTVHSGPLYAGHSGLTLLATDVRPFRDAEGVDRGVSPLIELRRGDTLIARHRVYPNNPLRYGSLLVHSSGYGLAAVISVETSAGSEMLSSQQLVDFDDKTGSGTTDSRFDLTADGNSPLATVRLTVPLDREGGVPQHILPKDARVSLRVQPVGRPAVTAVLRPGGTFALGPSYRIRLKGLVYYARVSVADDWSVYPLYLLFLLAGASVSVAVVVPYRRVIVLAVEVDSNLALHASARHSRGDPLFAERVEAALRQAAGGASAEEEESA